MAAYLPGWLECLNSPIIQCKLDESDIAYLGKYGDVKINIPKIMQDKKEDDSATNGNSDGKGQQQTYLSSLNSHIVDQDTNGSVNFTNKIVRNDSNLPYRRTTSSFSESLVNFINKTKSEEMQSTEFSNAETSGTNSETERYSMDPDIESMQTTMPDLLTSSISVDIKPKNEVNGDSLTKRFNEVNGVNFNNGYNEDNAVQLTKRFNGDNLAKNFNEDKQEIVWHPGFARQLGTKGRRVLLDLIRKVYRSSPDYYKNILSNKTPPTSISNLPFFNVTTLWELAHDFGIFKHALDIHFAHYNSAYSSPVAKKAHVAKPRKPAVKAKKVNYTFTELSDDYDENEYISSFPNAKTSRGRKITQPKKFSDYDKSLDIEINYSDLNDTQYYEAITSNNINKTLYSTFGIE